MQTTEDITTANWIHETMKRNGFDPTRAMNFLTAHYTARIAPPLYQAIPQFMKRIECKGTGWSRCRHLRESIEDFAESISHTSIEHITDTELLNWLSRWNANPPKTWNEKRSHVQSFLLFAVQQGWISRSPAAAIYPRPKGHRPVPEVLQPDCAARLMLWMEINAPEWVPYFAFCLFAGVRPDLSRGEARRLHNDLIGVPGGIGKRVINRNGFFVRGKRRKTRFVRWDDCGPLRAWLTAYPCSEGLIPRDLTIYDAARRLTEIRAVHKLPDNVLRHTAASAMLHVPLASFAAIAYRLENSEKMLIDHYIGIWEPDLTVALYAILPTASVRCPRTIPMLLAS